MNIYSHLHHSRKTKLTFYFSSAATTEPQKSLPSEPQIWLPQSDNRATYKSVYWRCCYIIVEIKTCSSSHIAISLSFSLSMFNRAAVRDFFSVERDLDRAVVECADRDRDLWCLERDVEWLGDWDRLDFWRDRLCDRERLHVWRVRLCDRDLLVVRCGRWWVDDGICRDLDVRLWCASGLRDRESNRFDSPDFDWWFLDL